MMKKTNILLMTILAVFLFGGTTLQAQGLFNKTEETTEKTNSESDEGGGAFFRGGGFDDKPGDPDAPGESEEEPIGEGILILSLFAGGYAMVKEKFKKRKYEG